MDQSFALQPVEHAGRARGRRPPPAPEPSGWRGRWRPTARAASWPRTKRSELAKAGWRGTGTRAAASRDGQPSRTGQVAQAGRRAMQTMAPNSMLACIQAAASAAVARGSAVARASAAACSCAGGAAAGSRSGGPASGGRWCPPLPPAARTPAPRRPGRCSGRRRATPPAHRSSLASPPRPAACRRGAAPGRGGCSQALTRRPAPRPSTPRPWLRVSGSAPGSPGKRSATREACVCCSITSLTSTAHGSVVLRQGTSRAAPAYQPRIRRRTVAAVRRPMGVERRSTCHAAERTPAASVP